MLSMILDRIVNYSTFRLVLKFQQSEGVNE
jgi:hypothetical protein